MSGFGSVIGFMFTFFIMIGIIYFGFFTMLDDITLKSELIDKSYELAIDELSSFSVQSSYYSSGRLTFYIQNEQNEPLPFIEDKKICFSLFENSNEYVNSDNFFITTTGSIAAPYSIIEPNSFGVLNYKTTKPQGSINFKIISCSGKEEIFNFNYSQLDWWNSNWQKRFTINITNQASSSLSEYQLELDLNNSNFDFSSGKQEEIRFLLPIKENYKLDLTFDDYTQQQEDYSDYGNVAYLGTSSAAEDSDPIQITGVLANGLYFNTNDSLRVLSNTSLNIDNSITYSMWVRWDTNGDTSQNLVFANYSILNIINDGGADDDKLQFNLNISGTIQTLTSNSTLDNNWHLVSATYDGAQMKIYFDDKLENTLSIVGEIVPSRSDIYIGSSNSSTNHYNGRLDELKIIDFALNLSEIDDLYQNNLRFKLLDHYTASWDSTLQTAKIFAKTPSIGANENITIHMYYKYNGEITDISNMETTFSYVRPRLIGYVSNDRISGSTGVSIISLYDNNEIWVGDDIFNLDEQDTTTLGSGSTEYNDSIYLKYLANVEGNGGGVDIIAPISWAGTEFVFGRPQNNPDRFCMLSPFGISTYEIFEVGTSVASGNVNQTGFCRDDLNIGSGANTYINSSLPILLYYYGSTSNDAYVMYPMEEGNYYGNPSGRVDWSAGPNGANLLWFGSDGTSGASSLAAYVDTASSGLGNDGAAYARKFIALDPVSILKETDGDGAELATYFPEHQMGIKFGSNEAMDYAVFGSPYPDANCSIYSSAGALLQNLPNGTGTNGIYNYSLGNIGTDTQFTGVGWKIECDKPVGGYVEKTNNDENNILGHPQMRQYIYPEPIITLS